MSNGKPIWWCQECRIWKPTSWYIVTLPQGMFYWMATSAPKWPTFCENLAPNIGSDWKYQIAGRLGAWHRRTSHGGSVECAWGDREKGFFCLGVELLNCLALCDMILLTFDKHRSSATSLMLGALEWQCGRCWALLTSPTRVWARQRWTTQHGVLQIVIVVVGQSKSGYGFVAMMVVKKVMVGQPWYFAQGEGETEDKQLHDGGAHQLPQTQQEELDCSLSGHNLFLNWSSENMVEQGCGLWMFISWQYWRGWQ